MRHITEYFLPAKVLVMCVDCATKLSHASGTKQKYVRRDYLKEFNKGEKYTRNDGSYSLPSIEQQTDAAATHSRA